MTEKAQKIFQRIRKRFNNPEKTDKILGEFNHSMLDPGASCHNRIARHRQSRDGCNLLLGARAVLASSLSSAGVARWSVISGSTYVTCTDKSVWL
jgi:hypothetical protein